MRWIMPTVKVAITLDQQLLAEIDQLVEQQVYPNRSKAIHSAVAETLRRRQRRRLAIESAKLNPREEQAMAEEGMMEDSVPWPEF